MTRYAIRLVVAGSALALVASLAHADQGLMIVKDLDPDRNQIVSPR